MPTKADEFDLEEGEANPWSDDDEEPVVESQDMEVDEDDESLDEEDLDDELQLPEELNKDISLEEKRKLYQYKKNHSEIEWEQHIDARMQQLSKQIDLQRLKKMRGLDTSNKNETVAAKAKSTRKSTRSKASKAQSGSDSESDKEIKAAAKASAARDSKLSDSDESVSNKKKPTSQKKVIEDDDSDDLFDSEEERKLSEKYRAKEESEDEDIEDAEVDAHFAATNKRKKQTTGRKGAKAKRSRSKYSDSEDDEESEQEADDDDLSVGGAVNVRQLKESYGLDRRRSNERGEGGTRAPKEKGFESLSELQKHLKESQQQELPAEDDDFDPADLNDYIKITLRRDQIVALLNEPYFQKYVTGCFVRYSLGAIESTPVYRLCEILKADFESRPYKVPAPNGNGNIETNLRLTLSTGGAAKEKVKIDRVSNHTIKQNELDFHLKGLESKKLSALNKRDIKLLRFHQKQYRNYIYTPDEIKRMVTNKVGLNKVLSTEYSNAMETLLKKRQEAIANCDDDARRAIQKTIDSIEKENERQKQVFEKAYRKQIETNKRMRENNTKRDLMASMQKLKEDKEAQAKGVIPNSIADPFVRRETRPTILWISKVKGEDAAADAKAATPRPAPAPVANVNQNAQINYEFVIPEETNFDEVRQRVIGYLGFDVVEAATMPPKERYLQSLHLPTSEEERNVLRAGNMTLSEYLSNLAAMETA